MFPLFVVCNGFLSNTSVIRAWHCSKGIHSTINCRPLTTIINFAPARIVINSTSSSTSLFETTHVDRSAAGYVRRHKALRGGDLSTHASLVALDISQTPNSGRVYFVRQVFVGATCLYTRQDGWPYLKAARRLAKARRFAVSDAYTLCSLLSDACILNVTFGNRDPPHMTENEAI